MNIGGHPGRVVMDGVSKQAASRFVASHASHSRSPMAGVSWNEAEHLAFLKGLQVFGKVCVVLIHERWSLEPGSYGPGIPPWRVAGMANCLPGLGC